VSLEVGDLKLAKQSVICFGIKPRLKDWRSQISGIAGPSSVAELSFIVWVDLLDSEGIASMMGTCCSEMSIASGMA
jgi:hypothetical protein